MTRASIKEYAEAIRIRYFRASKKEKGKILDEFIKVTGCHRKAAIRLLRHGDEPKGRKRPGRPPKYNNDVVKALKVVWEASDHLCSKRLHPFLPELLAVLKRQKEITIRAEIESVLCKISSSTIDRLLAPYRDTEGHRPVTTTRAGSLLKSSIPIRTFSDWTEDKPGFLECDLVAHCGESTEGFYLNTLSAVDVATGWIECLGVWGKGQIRVGSAIHRVRQQLPFKLLGLDSDNGSEFINQYLYEYCLRERITFTRSRSYKKNDNCYVEQKNWSVVRRLIGYDRYSSKAALEKLNQIYHLLHLYMNFFQPVMKLKSKTRAGAKVHKIYDSARTPYQRLLDSGVLTEDKREELRATYLRLNPVSLLKQIDENLGDLWGLAERPDKHQRITKILEVSVT
jgi:hypothetical protein